MLDKALAQLPDSMRDEHGKLHADRILVRTDSAGASREFLNHLHSLGLQFSTSYTLPVPNERFVHWINDKDLWERVIEQDGYERRDAWVIDATKVIKLHGYPAGTRLYLRAEPLHPGAQASIFDVDGHRVTAFLTNAPRWNVAFLDARHRARGRCENRICETWPRFAFCLVLDLTNHYFNVRKHSLTNPDEVMEGQNCQWGTGVQASHVSLITLQRGLRV